MVTTLPQVRVAPVEARRGFTVTCTACPGWKIRPLPRQEADLLAVEHRASHQTPCMRTTTPAGGSTDGRSDRRD